MIDTAPALWRSQQLLLSRLLEVDSAGAREFHEAESGGRPDLFLLLVTDLVKSIVPCPPEAEEAARDFVRNVAAVSDRLTGARPQRDARLAAIRTEKQARQTDRSAVERAQARLAAARADKGLVGAIQTSRERLEQIRADDSAVREKQRRVHELIDEIATPPEPLFAVPGDQERETHESRADPG
jgi:hypothetical protein